MDEKMIGTEFAKIYKMIENNSCDLIDTNKDLKKFVDMQRNIVRGINNHIDICNENFELMGDVVRKLNKYAKRQNFAILAGIVGFLYLCDRISQLEDSLKKE